MNVNLLQQVLEKEGNELRVVYVHDFSDSINSKSSIQTLDKRRPKSIGGVISGHEK